MSDFVNRWATFWAAPDPEQVHTLSAPDIVLRYPGRPEPLNGLDAWKAQVASIVERFPDVRLSVTHHATDGDLCFISWQATATAGGKAIFWEGIDRMLLKDGVVIDSMVAFDTAGLRR
ncbi:nuclear transport factor 2 family protein [Streptosporangium sp. NPDC001559]|uniref:nuclear transport factor 2 family protein n=1 Tax=Streptosporangium sp. NPDC001559 TaxID=3366187 RepID=UPI0036E86691